MQRLLFDTQGTKHDGQTYYHVWRTAQAYSLMGKMIQPFSQAINAVVLVLIPQLCITWNHMEELEHQKKHREREREREREISIFLQLLLGYLGFFHPMHAPAILTTLLVLGGAGIQLSIQCQS